MDQLQIFKDINKQISYLSYRDPFVYHFTSSLNIGLHSESDKPSFPLAAVGINSKTYNFELHVVVDAWEKLTDKIKQGVLMHEILHLVFYHLTEFTWMSKENHKLANIAMD
jgi:hypothetical protein